MSSDDNAIDVSSCLPTDLPETGSDEALGAILPAHTKAVESLRSFESLLPASRILLDNISLVQRAWRPIIAPKFFEASRALRDFGGAVRSFEALSNSRLEKLVDAAQASSFVTRHIEALSGNHLRQIIQGISSAKIEIPLRQIERFTTPVSFKGYENATAVAFKNIAALNNERLTTAISETFKRFESKNIHVSHDILTAASRAWKVLETSNLFVDIAVFHSANETCGTELIKNRIDYSERTQTFATSSIPRSDEPDHTLSIDILDCLSGSPESLIQLTRLSPPLPLVAFSIVIKLEETLRRFISLTLEAEFGPYWIEEHVSVGAAEFWQDRRSQALQRGEYEQPLIYYAEIGEYRNIILKRVFWERVFREYFKSKELVQIAFDRIIAIRNPAVHGRPVSKDSILELYVECKRLLDRITLFR